MKKLAKGILIAALAVSLGGTALLSAFTVMLRDAFRAYRQADVCRSISLSARVRELGEALAVLAPSDEQSTEAGASADAASDPSDDGAADGTGQLDDVCKGEVTHAPAHASEADPCAGAYRVTIWNGRIGVFDASGTLFRTVNVSVDTLPAADRAALAEGIRAGSPEEALRITEKYE